MALWIRSQDGSQLISTNNIFVRKYSTGENNTKHKITCIDNKLYRGWCNLGLYETKERALEVLDDIQDLLMGDIENHINKFDIYNGKNIKVYNMPKE